MTRSTFRGWPGGATAAVALTYDDALDQHLDVAIPTLEAAGLRATFYLPLNAPRLAARIADWRAAAGRGHELGNHSIFHPCRRDAPTDHAWMAEEYNLAAYTERRWLDEMTAANVALQMLDGRTRRTFGNTCCDEAIGPDKASLHPLIERLFPAARGPLNRQIVDPRTPHPAGLGHFSADHATFASLREIVDAAIVRGGLAILMAHGVGGGEHPLFIDADEHARLIAHLATERDAGRLWIAPLIEVADHLLEGVTP